MEGFGLLFTIVFFFFVDVQVLHKAGFTRWWAFLLVFTGPFGLMLLTLIEWPVLRELAWRRLKGGEFSESDTTRAESYAVNLERRGEWKKAAEVFSELERWAPSAEEANYYGNCLKRLHEKMGWAKADLGSLA